MSESLRDQLEAAFDQHTEEAPAPEAPAPTEAPAEVEQVTATTETAAPAEAPKADDRPRDEQGKFLPKDAAAGPGKSPSTPPPAKGASTAPAAAPAPTKAPRPSSWKKELEQHWETLPPEVQAYIGERERQYATGVSTYKNEADRAKHIMGAVAEFEPALQRHNIEPGQWIQNLGRAHFHLALGNQHQKVETAARLIQSYGIDAQALFQHLSGQQPQQHAPAQQPTFTQADIDARIQRQVDQRLANEKVNAAYEAFSQEVSAGKYPHFENVKETMGRLLETGFAKDYSSAYDIALRMPEHASLAQAAQQQSTVQTEAARQEAEQKKVQRARSQAVSVRSSTPSVMTQNSGPKGLREQLSDAYDRAAGGSRV